jgi:hypothetical protein
MLMCSFAICLDFLAKKIVYIHNRPFLKDVVLERTGKNMIYVCKTEKGSQIVLLIFSWPLKLLLGNCVIVLKRYCTF